MDFGRIIVGAHFGFTGDVRTGAAYLFEPDVLGPLVEDLFDAVDALDDLPQARGLLATLENAVVLALEQDKPEVAVNLLVAFIQQVEALIKSGRLQEPEGNELIDYAEELIEILIELSAP